ncbi:TPA: hypothetical protein ACJ1JR_001944 [Streptococcus pneumoniae]|nr:hypothetical protein [Streptococcus pneumoniae]HEV6865470.1 hypothetical protein [Streptococcus pneumoniae]HEV6897504.1 hypothetical protein [Streptococcus pneumoniae]HEV6945296.1 hypothetical protein [Streptococcus pneumoniae]HEV7074962.1 hypothetical protein [Streptococcus pneumoniae]
MSRWSDVRALFRLQLVEFLKEQYGQGRPDYIEALNDLDGLVEVSYREAIERFLEDDGRFKAKS